MATRGQLRVQTGAEVRWRVGLRVNYSPREVEVLRFARSRSWNWPSGKDWSRNARCRAGQGGEGGRGGVGVREALGFCQIR